MLDPDNKTNIKVIGGNFTDSFDMCDAYIFDHISTAFMIACATNKPIIYFNIGKRNLTEYARKLVHKRCYYINVDPEKPGDLIEKIHGVRAKECINYVTTSFSIDESIQNIDRDTSLINLVDSILKN
jgi:hypothetical protein